MHFASECNLAAIFTMLNDHVEAPSLAQIFIVWLKVVVVLRSRRGEAKKKKKRRGMVANKKCKTKGSCDLQVKQTFRSN